MNQIKFLRTGKSLTQEELAILSDVKLSTLQKAERGNIKRITLETALKLAKGLGVNIEELIKNG